MNIKLVKTDEEERQVYLDGEHVGEIYTGWLRLGGSGWMFSSMDQTYRSMKEAARALIKAKVGR
jgi:hypothetical protein